MSRIIKCDRPGYEHVKAYLPDEWKGKHSLLKDKAMHEAARMFPDNALFANIVLALHLVEKVEGVPELEGEPDEWDIAECPLHVISWLEETVNEDFLGSFASKRPSYQASTKLLQELLGKDLAKEALGSRPKSS